MSQSSTAPNVNALFQEAHEQGDLSAKSLQVLQNIGTHFAAALGTPAADVVASEVTTFAVLLDSSISMVPNVQHVIDGHNGVLDALLGSKQANSIMIHVRDFDKILHPFLLLPDADRLTTSFYRATKGNTPLYDSALDLLATTTAKAQEFASNGVPVRTITLVVTDGANNSSKHSEGDVETVVQDLLRAENHIVAGMGINDGYTDFKQVFKGMGIQDDWVLTPSNDPSSLRRAFAVVSQSAVRASQGAGAFSQVALGGFGN